MEPTAAPQAPTAAERIAAEHKLDVNHSKPQKGKGKLGSLENPEVYDNVPGHLIPAIEREFDDFDTEAGSFLAGEQSEEQFIGFRLKQGVYGQRQPDVQMIRTKLPMGGITPEQMEAFADAIEKYAPLNKGHITTRQNIQVHHIPLPDAAKFIREISDSGLSSREGCGNTVRNVTGGSVDGDQRGRAVRPDPVRRRLRPLLRPPPDHPADAAQGQDGVHRDRRGRRDHRHPRHRLLARERDGVRGVEVRVGGGTSIMPRVAPTLYDFVELDNGDYLKVSEAIFRIFDRQEWLRVNRARARIKVLIDKIGIDAFREMVDEELEGDWVNERDFSIDHLMYGPRRGGERPGPAGPPARARTGTAREFERFRAANVRPQRQEGFSTVQVKVTRGDLTPEQFRGLAQIMREYTGGSARTTVHQNFVLRWVRDEAVYEVWQPARRARPGGRRRRRDHRRRLVPRHRQLQARDHRLDGPQPGDPGAGRVDADLRSADQAGPHQDVGLPERLQPAPHREHRLLRRLA